MINVGNDWQDFFDKEFQKPYYKKLRDFLVEEYKTQTVYPPMEDIFNAFKLTPLARTKVVIIGQDCYHGAGQAMGLSFSVNDGIKLPPSLRNIYKEIESDLGIKKDYTNGNLTSWAEQGVLLLNACLTVREHQPNSHAGHGWEDLTSNVILELDHDDNPKVFLLWGAYAQKKEGLINNPRHLVLKATHPSPLSAYNGFFGCKHFSKTNEFLVVNGFDPIDW